MTAPTKAWVTIDDGAVDPDSPLDAALLTGLRDNLVHLEEWLGKDYTAAQNHTHDGVDSALVEIGPNALRNGSFEAGTNGWTLAAYTGGSLATNTSNDMDGATALGITSTVLANGGGTATSNAFINCTGGNPVGFEVTYKASAANISSRAQVQWFDDAQASISTSTIYTSTNTPTAKTTVIASVTAPDTARYYKVILTGGIPATGSGTGTVYFDGVIAGAAPGEVILETGTVSSAATLDIPLAKYAGFRRLRLELDGWVPVTASVYLYMRTSTDNASTFASANYNYALSGHNSGSTFTPAGGGSADMYITDATVNNITTFALSAVIYINERLNSAKYTTVMSDAVYYNNSAQSVRAYAANTRVSAEVNNGIRLYFSSGNISAGNYRLIGGN